MTFSLLEVVCGTTLCSCHHLSRTWSSHQQLISLQCDEQKPACGNCTRHNATCDFLSYGTPRPSPSSPGAGSSELNMVDLELLHNFTTSTYATLAESLTMRDFYRINVVRMSFKHEYIMRTLLALSALHLAHHKTQCSDHYYSLALAHHQVASQTALTLMDNVNSENAPMLFLFSNLTMIFGMCRSSHHILPSIPNMI